MKKIFFVFLILLFYSVSFFAQEDSLLDSQAENQDLQNDKADYQAGDLDYQDENSESETYSENGDNSEYEENLESGDEIETRAEPSVIGPFGSTFVFPKTGKEFLHQISPFVNIGAAFTLNTESNLVSAPSPINFAISIGAIWPNNAFISFQPRIAFYMSYYLWDGENALPAEAENRTALALSFMFDLPAAFTFRFEKCQVEVGAGVGFLARLAVMAKNVSESDFGHDAYSTAGQDKDEIKKWFWKNLRFLYPEVFVGWEWNFTRRIAAGLEARYYFPLGSLINGRGFDASIIMASSKLIF